MRRLLPYVAVVAVALAGLVVGASLGDDDAGPAPGELALRELARVEQARATARPPGAESLDDVLTRGGRGFPYTFLGRVVDVDISHGYGFVEPELTVECPEGASCSAGAPVWERLAADDVRADEVYLSVTIAVDEVLAVGEGSPPPPDRLKVEWLIAGPHSLAPQDPASVELALRSLGRALWVTTAPSEIPTNVAWLPHGVARIVDGRVVPVLAGGTLPPRIDTLDELRRQVHPRPTG